MNQTGQPLADAGRAIAAVLAKKTSIEDANTPELIAALKFLDSNIDGAKRPPKAVNKLLILAKFWQNNAFVQTNVGADAPFKKKIADLLQPVTPTKYGYCQICGKHDVFSKIDRTWMPLAGGVKGDPCSFPSLGGKLVCADCFRSLVILPLGCGFCKAGPYLFHVSDPELQVEAMARNVNKIKQAIANKERGNNAFKAETILSGRLELLEIVAGDLLWDHTQTGILTRRPEDGTTIISFSNEGTGAKWNQLHLPAQALEFLADIAEAGVTEVFIGWAKMCAPEKVSKSGLKEKVPNEIFQRICDDVEQRRSLAFLVSRIVRGRTKPVLTIKEKQVIEIYEKTAINKGERFDAMERISQRVKSMEDQHRASFIKQLSNLRDRDELLELLRKYAKSEKTKDAMRLMPDDYRIIYNSPPTELACLLYLLCVAEEA